MKIEGKRVLVTGGSSGIGLALAHVGVSVLSVQKMAVQGR